MLTDGRSTTIHPRREGRAFVLLPSRAVGRAQRFEITVEGHTHRVTVALDERGQPTAVEVDDTPCTVQLGADEKFLVGPGDGPQQIVALAPGRRPDHAVIGGVYVDLEVKTAREAALEAALASADGGSTGGSVHAPMPGRVVRVMVEVGDQVERDAPLLIVEAMKMENEVHAPSAGRVRTVTVTTGQTVDAGQLLVEFDDEDAPA